MPGPETEEDVPILAAGDASERARAGVAACLRRARFVVLSSHEKVDADGAGSALGLAAGLRAIGTEAVVAIPSPLPENLRFLPGAADCVVVERGTPIPDHLRAADVFVSLDCGGASRLGGLLPLAEACPVFLNVDHHASNEGFGTTRWVDDSYAAVGVMAFELLCELGAPLLREACIPLYTALVYDTGGFAFSNADPRSHRMAAACIERGVRPEAVTAALHRSRSLDSWKFSSEALATLRTTEDGAIAWMTITRDLIERHGLGEGRLPELIEVPVSLASTRLAFLLTEIEGRGGVRVSLRSRCPVGVHLCPAPPGGGGHARAAGMTLPGSLADAEAVVLAGLRASLKEFSDSRRTAGLPPQDA